MFFWQGLLAHPLQHALWLSPALSHNFRGTFAKISLFTDPGHQQGVHWRKSEHQHPWFLALAKPHFWKLGYCIWSLFLGTSTSIIRQWQRQVQGCASGPWRLAVAKPRLWKLGCYLWRVWLSTSTTTQGPEPETNRNSLVPFSCRTPGGSGWQPFTQWLWYPTFAKLSRKKMLPSRTRKKTFARVSNITRTAFAIKTPYKDL